MLSPQHQIISMVLLVSERKKNRLIFSSLSVNIHLHEDNTILQNKTFHNVRATVPKYVKIN